MSIVPPPPQPIFETSSSGNHKPAEVFRKDLISAMKLPDSYQLQPEEYYLISDQWKQEWEKGVQVPVNPDDYPEPVVKTIALRWQRAEFKLPKKLLKYEATDEQSASTLHQLASQVCRYDLDDTDTQWLKIVNREREDVGDLPIDELTMETLMEECEKQCHDNMTHVILTQEGLGIEYDEDVICDVCRSPDCEEGNEMVFCDSCDICVHQACYGIVKIPEGSWMCRTCALGIQPTCILCPKKKGAMKSTRSGAKWAHVSCALWVPEVSIGCVEKMEPITKISQIPASRWSLICSLCRERTGACIQCSVKTCKTAYHVSCGFQHSLEMKTYLDDAAEVKFKSLCMRHTKRRLQGEVDVIDSPMKTTPKKEKTQEEKANERALGIQQLEDEFYKQLRAKDVAAVLNMKDDIDAVDKVCEYWKLKRKSNFNRPLLPPKKEESGAMSQAEEDSLIARMRMFVHLRQDLERVRNLCYMVQKREKLSRQSNKLREQIFHKQSELLSDDSVPLNNNDFEWVRTAIIRSESQIMTLVRTDNEGSESASSESTGHEDTSDSNQSEGSSSNASKDSSRSKRSRRFRSQGSKPLTPSSKESLSSSKDSVSSRESQLLSVMGRERRRSASITLKMETYAVESLPRNVNNSERIEHRATNNNQVTVNKEDSVPVKYECESGQKENKQDDVLSMSNMKRKIEPDPKGGTRSKRQRSNGSYDTLARRRIDTLFGKGNPVTVVPRVKLERTNLDPETFKNRKHCDKNKNRTPSSGINERLRVLRRTEISPRQESMRDEAAKVRESLFPTQSSPKGSLSGYRIPKKNSNPSSIVKDRVITNVKENLDKQGLDNDVYTLKTRSATRKLDNEIDMDSIAPDRQFEYVDDEVSICRSSRDPSLAAESDDSGSHLSSVRSGPVLRTSRHRRSESSNDSHDIVRSRSALQTSRYRRSESSSNDSQDESGSNSDSIDVENSSNVYDSDSEGSSSSDGRHSGPVTRRRKKRSCSATSKRPFRSRVTDAVGRLWNTASGF